MKERLLTTREASKILKFSEKEVIDLASAGLIPNFKVGGEFLRFKKDDILEVKKTLRKRPHFSHDNFRGLKKMREFLYFNDFYILSTIVIITLLWIIIKDILP